MALNKSKDWLALSYHVTVYTLVTLGIIVLWTGHAQTGAYAVVFFPHFIVDAITSRVTSRLWFVMPFNEAAYDTIAPYPFLGYKPTYDAVKRHWFFVMIGFDQLLHAVCLAATLRWIP